VARLRLVHGREGRPATVYLLTNLPLNLEVSELVTWNELMRDRPAEACRRWRGVWLISPSELSRCAQDLWPTPKSAKREAEKRNKAPKCSISILEEMGALFPAYPAGGNAPATLVEYRRAGQRGPHPHRAYIPGDVRCEVTARVYLEAITGTVATLRIVGTLRRDRPEQRLPAVTEDAGELPPLAVPFSVPPRVHVLDVCEAWAIGPERLERWNLHSGHEILMPVELGRDVQLAANVGGAPTSFARASPSG
jgi:hypothetical protein